MAESIGVLIKRLREAAELTQGQVAKYARVNRTWLAKLEAGYFKRRPDREKLEAIARVLRTPPEELLAAAGYRVTVPPPLPELTPAEMVKRLAARLEEEERRRPILVPLIETAAVSAGPGGYAEMQVPYIPQPHERGHAFIAVPIVGDCMEPEIHAGDIAIIDMSAEPRSGEIVAAERDHEYLIKRLERRNSELWLVANQGQEPIRVTEQIRLIGVVRGA